MNILKRVGSGIASGATKVWSSLKRNVGKAAAVVVAGIALVRGNVAHAQTDATVIATSVNSAFLVVAASCITIGTFFVVYRLVKRIK